MIASPISASSGQRMQAPRSSLRPPVFDGSNRITLHEQHLHHLRGFLLFSIDLQLLRPKGWGWVATHVTLFLTVRHHIFKDCF